MTFFLLSHQANSRISNITISVPSTNLSIRLRTDGANSCFPILLEKLRLPQKFLHLEVLGVTSPASFEAYRTLPSKIYRFRAREIER